MSNVAKIIILIGQSNAVGVGYYEYLPNHFSAEKVEELMKGYKNVRINFYSHDFGSNGFTDTKVSLAELTKKTFGPELGIAEKLNSDFPDQTFYIVKFAIGGTTLFHDWLSPTSRKKECKASCGELSYGYCYDGFAELLRKSIDLLKDKGLSPEIRAVCWMQGESDACDKINVDAYPSRFDDLIKDFENEFKPYLKNYVLVDGGISPEWEFYREMNAFKKSYANGKNRKFIDTIGEGLTTVNEPVGNPDRPHYDSDSVIKLGNMFESAIKENLN